MKNKTSTISLLSVALALAFACYIHAASADPVTLQHAFTEGDILVYSIEMEGTGNVEIEGAPLAGRQPGKFFTDVKNLIELNVTGVDESGNAEIEGRIKDWEMRFNGNTITSKTGHPSGVDAPIIERMKKPFKMKISRHGEMLDFQGELFDKDLFPFNTGGEQLGWTSSMPKHPVEIGDSWAEDLPPVFRAADENNKPQIIYTLTGFETVKGIDCAVIETRMDETDISPDESSFSIPGFSGMNTKLKSFTQDMNGKLYFAHRAGVLIGFEFEMNQFGDLEITYAPNTAPMKMKLNLKIDGVVNLE